MAKYPDVTSGQTEACINRMGGWDNFLRYIGGQGKIVFDTILSLVRIVKIGAQSATTTSEKYFEEVDVKSMENNFKTQFLRLEVVATEDTELAIHKLKEASLDVPILAERGDKAETTVSQFRAFLAAHRESKEWFIFYLRGKDGSLWAVNAGLGLEPRRLARQRELCRVSGQVECWLSGGFPQLDTLFLRHFAKSVGRFSRGAFFYIIKINLLASLSKVRGGRCMLIKSVSKNKIVWELASSKDRPC